MKLKNLTWKQADKLYKTMTSQGIEILYDDRDESNGAKLGDADLLGMPVRILVSKKTEGKVEFKLRAWDETELLSEEQAIEKVKEMIAAA